MVKKNDMRGTMFMSMYLKMTIFSTKIAKFTTTFLYELIMAHEWVQ